MFDPIWQNQSKIIHYPNWNHSKAEDGKFTIKNKIILKKNIKNYGFYYKNAQIIPPIQYQLKPDL